MEQRNSLFLYTHSVFQKRKSKRPIMIFETICKKDRGKYLAKKLECTGKPLWRYGDPDASFTEEQWRKELADDWASKYHFPALYKVEEEYDKREVVICFLMTSQLSMELADQMLDELSVKNQNYEMRRLYPLHYKEGFFRMLLEWNQLHGHLLEFPEALQLFEEYEKKLVVNLLKKWEELRKNYELLQLSEEKEKTKDTGGTDDIKKLQCFFHWAEEIRKKAEGWKEPLLFYEQDELQRYIVLISHIERCMMELKSEKTIDMRERNSGTRPEHARGTKLCKEISRKCAESPKVEDAIQIFLEEAIIPMGEAYWRAFSWLMKSYSNAGEAKSRDSILLRPKVPSARNYHARGYVSVPLFMAEAPEQDILSFSLDPEAVKDYIQEHSANTVLLAELLSPMQRNYEHVFGKQGSGISQTALSELLNGYLSWLKGEKSRQSRKKKRVPTPFFGYRRELMIKYALACGCASHAEMRKFLEFTGLDAFSDIQFSEGLVSAALEWYERLSFDEKKTISPIMIILDMQICLTWFISEKSTERTGENNFQELLDQAANSIQKSLFYETTVPSRIQCGTRSSKGDWLRRYYSFQAGLWMLASVCVRSWKLWDEEKGAPSLPERFLNDYLGETSGKQYVSCGFLEFLWEKRRFSISYLKDRKEDLREALSTYERTRPTPEDRKTVIGLLEVLNRNTGFLSEARISNSTELKLLYEIWYGTLALCMLTFDIKNDQELFEKLKESNHELGSFCLKWAFCGGIRNFSSAYYEKMFQINSYAKNYKKNGDYDRWEKYISGTERELEIWDQMKEDIGIISYLYLFIQKNDAELFTFLYSDITELNKRLKKIRSEIQDLMDRPGKDFEDDQLKRKLEATKRSLRLPE